MQKKPDPFKRKLYQQQFIKLMIISTFIYVVSALFIRLITTLQTTLFLKFFSIKFEYRPFGVLFHTFGGVNWTDTRIMIVYGIGTIIFFLIGLLILKILSSKIHLGFLTRLSLTWTAFLIIHILPMGMFTGIFIFDGFGVAYTWLFENVLIRMLLALVALILTVYMRPFWLLLFLKTAYSTEILLSFDDRKDYIIRTLKIPWIIGTLILIPFTIVGYYWSWFVYLLGLGLIILPIFNPLFPVDNPRIFRSSGPVFSTKISLPIMIIIIIWLFIASFLHFDF